MLEMGVVCMEPSWACLDTLELIEDDSKSYV